MRKVISKLPEWVKKPLRRTINIVRALPYYGKERRIFFDGKAKKMLHVAPEHCFESKFKEQLGDKYLTADLFSPRAMVKMDITDIQYSDQSFDVIY